MLTSGNYATLALPGGYVGPVAVRNTQNFTIVITAIVVGVGYAIEPASVLTVGTQIPPGGVISPALIIAAADTTPPTISLNGVSHMTVEWVFGQFIEPGTTWTDNVDGSGNVPNITGTVGVTLGTYTISYTKTDAAGNTGTATRTIDIVCPLGYVPFGDGTCTGD